MPARAELPQPKKEKKGVIGLYQKFNKISLAIGLGVLGGAILLKNKALMSIALAAVTIDALQAYALGKFENSRRQRRTQELAIQV